MRKLARQISFLLIYSSDMGKTDYKEVLRYYLNEDNLRRLFSCRKYYLCIS